MLIDGYCSYPVLQATSFLGIYIDTRTLGLKLDQKGYESKQVAFIMRYDNKTVAGALLFIGSVQCLLGLIVAESLYPNYSVSENYISDLGVGSTSTIFNSSVFLLGLFLIACAYFTQRAFDFSLLSAVLVVAGVGAMGVGVFPETIATAHFLASLIVFLFGALSTILSYRLVKPPFSHFAVLLGIVSLVALALFGADIDLSLGRGGMERMIAYPELLWAVGLGSYLMGVSES